MDYQFYLNVQRSNSNRMASRNNNNILDKSVWIAISDIAAKVPCALGWMPKMRNSKRSHKKYKNVYKLHILISMLDDILYNFVEIVYMGLFDRACDDCFYEHENPFDVARDFLNNTHALQKSPASYDLRNSHWHKRLHEDAEWAKTILVKDFINDIVTHACNNHACSDHSLEYINAEATMQIVFERHFNMIAEDLVLLAVSGNYHCNETTWQYTPFEAGTAIPRDLLNSVRIMISNGKFDLWTRNVWVETWE